MASETTSIIVALIAGISALGGTALATFVNVKQIHDELKAQRLDILKLTVMNKDMPISERLIAGKLYVEKGGNGDVKHTYEALKEGVDHENKLESKTPQ